MNPDETKENERACSENLIRRLTKRRCGVNDKSGGEPNDNCYDK